MAIHLLRDYQTQNITNSNREFIYTYLLSIFLRRVLLYSYVGDTNYNINSIGTLLIATGDSTPTGTPTFATGSKAGINLGAQKEFYVSIPVSVRTVTSADIGRLLVLRSTAFPRYNSGIFLILGFETSTNSYVIDYRTLGDPPPVEAADSIAWYIYEKDLNCPTSGGSNTKTSAEYLSDLTSNTPRIVLQSPHSTGWQVRICNEGSGSYASNLSNRNCPRMTVAPGFGGTAAGDFPAFGQHFHAPMWFNSSSTIYLGGAPGFGDGGTSGIQFRITMVGDDTGQGVTVYGRRPGNATQPDSNIVTFGLAENEPAPLPVNTVARLFVLGSGFTGDDGFGSRSVNDGALFQMLGSPANSFFLSRGAAQGMSATTFGVPVQLAASFWTYVTGVAQGASPMFDSNGGDSPFTNATELLPIDLVQGTLSSYGNQTVQVYPYSPRPMGTIPHLRSGRTNFGDFSPTTENGRAYQHLRRGLYIPWAGPNIIP